ncbi:nucleolar complex-associated protein 3 [Ephemerocybe angulata]|uniref:Nucleolar complex-associated protein 3 n=1 Tax=Ephemerocybe angulata TaxID=980116 RepID=A0A8H6IHR1_9AGAR|nr:nucleolar complex-associated protein 3 [Tulosesus angulatus]
MAPKGGKGKKRTAPASQASIQKKRKVDKDAPRKEKFADRGFIPVPENGDDDDELSDEDTGMLEEFGSSVGFLQQLDKKGIMRSKKETVRLYEMNKPVRRAATPDSLPPIDSDGESGEDAWSSGVEDISDVDSISGDGSDGEDDFSDHFDDDAEDDSDEEMAYEQAPRKMKVPEEKNEVPRLPIKLADGKIRSTGTKSLKVAPKDESEDDSSSEEERESTPPPAREDVATGARFGRPAVATVLHTKSRKQRIELAKDQIAGICQDILADPEQSLGLLRRLHTFALHQVTVPNEEQPILNDIVIRKLAILSQLAVFKDIIPGYRIRELTELEKSEKVGQLVARTREWEQGLVGVYQAYLRLLDRELKARSELADIAIHCMCTLLTEVTHFNFRQNLMTFIVARMSKKSWDETSERCLKALNSVFRADLTGVPSLEIVRILNRMVKERRFKVHPNVMSCLLNLRLRTELGVRASQTRVDKEVQEKLSFKQRQKKKDQPHLSKKAKKALKERKEIEKDLREAEAEVDKEERAITQTETLKMLFALYFRILKSPTPTVLLPAALSGISKFAHLVNIDFFKDLMQVLKDLIDLDTTVDPEESDVKVASGSLGEFRNVCHRLLCINTAFELLSGQGEALNIDLTDFISQLFAMILPLSLMHDIDKPHPGIQSITSAAIAAASTNKTDRPSSIADLLFRALNVVFSPTTSGAGGASGPPWRAAAFSKRLLGAAMHWPAPVAVRAVQFVKSLVAKYPKLEALLSTEDRTYNGIYRPDVDDPQLCQPFESSFWELHLLQRRHWDPRVREEAKKLCNFSPNSAS